MSGYERVARSEADAGERSTLFDAPAGGDGAHAVASAPAPPTSAAATSRLSLLGAGAFLWRDLVTSLRGGDPEPTPVELVRRFAEGLRRDYGAGLPLAPPAPPPPAAAASSSSSAAPAPRGPGPAWMEAAFQEAILAADTRCAPLFIYLHSDLHEDAPDFVRRGLFDPAVAAALDGSFVAWGGSVHARDGLEAAAAFQASGFPFVGVFASAPGSTAARPKFTRVWTHEGGGLPVPEGLLAGLRTALATARETLDGIRAERTARDHDRNLREEQDRSFREAEEADRRRVAERLAQRRAEEERRLHEEAEAAQAAAHAEEAAELQAAIALSEQLDAESTLAAARRRLDAHPEPPAGSKDVTSLRLTLPSGAKVQRRFASTDTLATVRDFVFATAHELGAPLGSPDGFELTCSYPKRTFPPTPEASAQDLKAAGLHPQAVLFVTPLSSGGSTPAAAS